MDRFSCSIVQKSINILQNNHKIIGNCQNMKSKMNWLGRHSNIMKSLVDLDKGSDFNICHYELMKDAKRTVN